MPGYLVRGPDSSHPKAISHNIRHLIHRGKPQKQAVAIALNIAERDAHPTLSEILHGGGLFDWVSSVVRFFIGKKPSTYQPKNDITHELSSTNRAYRNSTVVGGDDWASRRDDWFKRMGHGLTRLLMSHLKHRGHYD